MKISVFELAYRYVYPSVKKRLVEILHGEHGLSQWRISKLLYMDQSTVSRYIGRERGVLIDLSRYRDVDILLHRYADTIVKENPDKYKLMKDLVKITLWIMGRGYICGYHRELDDSVEVSKCGICLHLFRGFNVDDESHGREA